MVAEAEIALVSCDLGWRPKMLETVRAYAVLELATVGEPADRVGHRDAVGHRGEHDLRAAEGLQLGTHILGLTVDVVPGAELVRRELDRRRGAGGGEPVLSAKSERAASFSGNIRSWVNLFPPNKTWK